jgi:predicted dehydrogenase
MKPNDPQQAIDPGQDSSPSRRNFIKGSSMMLAGGAIVGGNLSVARGAHAFGSDTIRIGLVGCGSRGTGAAIQALNTVGGEVKLVAMADVFKNNLQTAFRTIKGKHPDRVDVKDNRFVGLDAFRQLLATDADVVILATPPGFRPQQFEAAVAAGKHVFMEKPVATDAPGVRRVLAANQLAKTNGLAVGVGLQRRHEHRYAECIDRLQQGAIGDLLFARAYWNGGGVRVRPRTAKQSELEYQIRNWYYFTWLCGDHIGEQHIHNLDVINWLVQGYPVEAQGQGGRGVRDGRDHGQIFDHHMVEFTYADGFKLISQCRHIRGCWNSISEHVHGSAGSSDISNALIRDAKGNKVWQSQRQEINGKGWQQEQHDFFAALRKGDTPNEADHGALSTMTAILGRLATYSGKVVRWDDALNSEISLADTDSLHSFDDAAPVQPDKDGRYPVPVPGSKTRFV